MSTLTEADLEHADRLADRHHAACVRDGCQKEHERDLWRIIHGSPAATVKRGA